MLKSILSFHALDRFQLLRFGHVYADDVNFEPSGDVFVENLLGL